MSVPAFANTYQFSVNNLHNYSSQENLMSQFLLQMESFYTGATSNPWTLKGSSNGQTYGWPGPGLGYLGGVDWDNEGTAHSWAVYEPASSCFQLLFNCHNNNSLTLQIGEWVSGTGSVSAGPTAVTAGTRVSDDSQGTNVTGQYRFSFVHANNGEFDFMVMTDPTHYQRTVYCLSKLVNPVDTFTNPWCFFAYIWETYYSADNFHLYDTSYAFGMWETNAWAGFQGGAVGSLSNYWTGRPLLESAMGFAMGESGNNTGIANEISGEWTMYPVGMCGYSGGDYGSIGKFADLYFVGNTTGGLNTGDTIEDNPASPLFKWAVFGDFAVPWAGVAPIV